MVPSPPQISGEFDEFNGNTWIDDTPLIFSIFAINPPVLPDSSIRVVINGISSNTQPLFEDEVNLNVTGSVNTVVTVQRKQDGAELDFKFDTDFVIDSFELYIDSVKVINTNA